MKYPGVCCAGKEEGGGLKLRRAHGLGMALETRRKMLEAACSLRPDTASAHITCIPSDGIVSRIGT